MRIRHPNVRRGRSYLIAALSIVLLLGTALSGSYASAQSEPTPLYLPMIKLGQDANLILPNQYIVLLSEVRSNQVNASSALSVAQKAGALAVQYGGTVSYTYAHAVQGYAAQMSADAAAALAKDPAVAVVEPDRIISIAGEQTPVSWGLDRVDQHSLPLDNGYHYEYTGAGVHAYIVDTGMRATHQEFTGRIGKGYSAVSDGLGTADCNGHGTHVAGVTGGTTYGIAKKVTLHPVRIFNCSGTGSTSSALAGIDWITANHIKPAIANMSLGGSPSNVLDTAVRNAVASGVVIAVAAGNTKSDACQQSPARVEGVLTVGASTSHDQRATFSNMGVCVDLFAPGVDIVSSANGSDTSITIYAGTSMATPYVSGAVALYLEQHPEAEPEQVMRELVENASEGQLTDIGAGSPNKLLRTVFEEDSPQATVCGDAITNGDLEAKPTQWKQASREGHVLLCNDTLCGAQLVAHGGEHVAWLGGANQERALLYQTLTLPPEQETTLNFWHWIDSEDVCGRDFGYVRVRLDGITRTLQRYDLCAGNNSAGWANAQLELGEYAGQTVRILFYVRTNRTRTSSWLIDDVAALSGAGCPVSKASAQSSGDGGEAFEFEEEVLEADDAADPDLEAEQPPVPSARFQRP